MKNKNIFMNVGLIALSLSTSLYAGSSSGEVAKSTASCGCGDATENAGWEVTGAAGLALADGNSESLAYSLQLLATRITATDETYLGADYFYADDKGTETTNAFRLFGQYNRLLSNNLYYGVTGNYLTDNVADLDYRLDLNVVLGYYIMKTDVATLAVEAGPGYSWEKQGGIKDDYMNIRFGEKFEYHFNNRSKLWQSLTYTPEAGDFNNYLLTGEIGIDTLISPQWSLRTFVRHQIDNTPALGRGKDDTTLMVGLGYSLSGFPEPAAPGRRTLKADRKPSPIAAMGWTTSAALGYSLAKGNSDNSAFNMMFDAAHRSTADEFFFNAASSYAENNGSTSIDNLRAGVQYNRLIGSQYFYGFGTGFARDNQADLDYRFTPAAVLGMYLIKNDTTTLSVEAGPGYTFEKVGGQTSDYLSVQAAEKFVWALSPRCTFNQASIYNAEASDIENFTWTNTAFLDTDITSNLALRVAASYIYDNTPAQGRELHDTTLTSGIAVKF